MNIPIIIKNKNVLIAGAGGGYDVFCGVPLARELIKSGNKIIFANYSFTNLSMVRNCEKLGEKCVLINENSELEEGDYFPEYLLAKWLRENNIKDRGIYCYSNIGVKSLKDIFKQIAKREKIDAVFIVDGGCDGIFRGDEYDLGTPSMDSISIIAASLLGMKDSYYIFTAFGSEGVNKKISHAEVLKRISDLIKGDAFLGCCSLVNVDKVTKEFDNCIEYVYRNVSEQRKSNILSSIQHAYHGSFGDIEVNEKSSHSPIWVSPLTSIYWFLKLEETAKMKLFYRDCINTDSVSEVADSIEKYRKSKPYEKERIPI